MALRRDSVDDDFAFGGTLPLQETGEEVDKAPDLLPEHCTYRDEGCELAISCLNCPFPSCVLEQPGGKRRWQKRLRDREMARLVTSEGKKTKELAQKFGISRRTVQRVLRRAKSE
jgi:AraC-like DNA-binding protein